MATQVTTTRTQQQLHTLSIEKRKVFDLLKDVGLALTSMLGKYCEVVIHDTTDPEHSIVWIEGDVTGRRVGDTMSDAGLEKLRTGDTHPLFNYTTYTDTGQTLKRASIWLRGSSGEIYGAFCINLDFTAVELLHNLVRDLGPDACRVDFGQAYAKTLHDMLDTMIGECEYRIGRPAERMSKDQRVEMVRMLDARGAFQVRNSVGYVASRVGVTRKTIYNDLREVSQSKGLQQVT